MPIGSATSGRPEKKARRLGAHLAFLEESGVLLIPPRRRTWAPQGETPILRSTYTHARLSALATRTVAAYRQPMGLYVRFQPDNFTAGPGADFLRALRRQRRGHVILLWDHGSLPRGPALAAVQQAYPRLPIEEFPAYAPELNPVEQLGNAVKGHTANSLPRHKRHLRRSWPSNTRRVRRAQETWRSFMRASALPSRP